MKVNREARALAGERKRLRTRAALLDAAMRVIAAKGPHAATIDDFTAEAGVSRGTFYNYFPTGDDLVLSLMDDLVVALDQRIEATMDGVASPAERMAHACLTFIEKGVDDPLWGWVFLQLDATSIAYVEQARRRFQIEFERGVAAGCFTAPSVAAGYSLTAGAVRMAVRSMLSGADRDCGLQTVEMILIGLGVDRAEAVRACRARQARPAI